MVRWTDVDVFLAVAEAGSFRGAAGRLSVTKSTVGRAIARLEEHLGTALILRDTASLRLTDAGHAYWRGARRAAAALAEAERTVGSLAETMAGAIRVTAPPAFGPEILAPICASFLAAHPEVALDLMLTDRLVNPLEDDIDLAIRVGPRLADSDLKSRRLARLELGVFAAPAVATRIETEGEVPAVLFVRGHGAVMTYEGGPPLRSRARVNDYLTLRELVLAGVGVGVMSGPLVAADVAAGRLERVLPEWKIPHGWMWAVYPSRGTLPVRLRRFVDHLVAGLAAQ